MTATLERSAGNTDVGDDEEPHASRLVRWAKRLTDRPGFQTTVIVVILLNALVLALETYPGIKNSLSGAWHWIDRAFLVFFVGELILRFGAVGFSARQFFARGWNIFDFSIVAVAFIPGLPPDSTVLRLARLARVTRLLAVLPDVKVLLDGIRRSLQPVSGLAVITVFLLFIYGMIGHTLFAEAAPEQWGTIGTAMLTLFTVLTLEAWPDIFAVVKDVSPWSTVYFISFLLGAVFIVMNMVVGVILGTLEEAREAARERRDEATIEATATLAAEDKARDEAIIDAIADLRAELVTLRAARTEPTVVDAS